MAFKTKFVRMMKDEKRPTALDRVLHPRVSAIVLSERKAFHRITSRIMESEPAEASSIVSAEQGKAHGKLTKAGRYARTLTIRRALNNVRGVRRGVGWENEAGPRYLKLLENIGLDMWCETHRRMPEPGAKIFRN